MDHHPIESYSSSLYIIHQYSGARKPCQPFARGFQNKNPQNAGLCEKQMAGPLPGIKAEMPGEGGFSFCIEREGICIYFTGFCRIFYNFHCIYRIFLL